eukprot:COSAG02_NODE_1447_length_12575_cov_8.479400_1_plen_296_part_00
MVVWCILSATVFPAFCQNLETRAQKVAAALLLDECRPLLAALFLSPSRASGAAPLRVAAVGGGPGFESIGLVALAVHLRAQVAVECLSIDNEAGWEELLALVVGATCDAAGNPCCAYVAPETISSDARSQRQPEPQPDSEPEPEPSTLAQAHRIAFVEGDCLTGQAGAQLLSVAPDMDLFTFNYVLVENAKALRDDGFSYLRSVFGAAKVGSVFVFMDASYHLWAEVVEAFSSAQDSEAQPQSRFAVLHPHPQPWQCTSTMLAVKLFPKDPRDERNVKPLATVPAAAAPNELCSE